MTRSWPFFNQWDTMPGGVTDIFREGTLEMSPSPLNPSAQALLWGDCVVNRILVVLSVLAFFILVADYLRLMPSLLDCLSRYRACVTLEHSVSKSRSRNALAAFSAAPFCLVADRYGLMMPSFWADAAPGWRFFLVLSLLAGFFLLRSVLYLVVRPKRLNSEELTAVRRCIFNFFILLTALAVLTVLALHVFHVSDGGMKAVLLVETGLFSAVHIARSGQILSSHSFGLPTFLYLCALELLPFGTIIFICTR